LRKLVIFFATGLYIGYLPIAPGTWGTLLGLLTYLLFSALPPLFYALATVATFFLAIWVSHWAEIYLSQKDSPHIIFDEVVGILVTMFLIPPTWLTILLGFLFFRLFDIMKPPPAGLINRKLKGGWGIVLDDAVAGIYGSIVGCFFYYLWK